METYKTLCKLFLIDANIDYNVYQWIALDKKNGGVHVYRNLPTYEDQDDPRRRVWLYSTPKDAKERGRNFIRVGNIESPTIDWRESLMTIEELFDD